jgi:hypothetical protein
MKETARNHNNVSGTMRAYPNVNYRYYFHEPQYGQNWIDFRNETTWEFQMQGRQQAQDMLDASEQGFNGFETLQEWSKNYDDLQKDYSNFGQYYKAVLKSYLPMF